MNEPKLSFLSNIVGRDTYDVIKSYSKAIVMIGICILAILLGLSRICHYVFVSKLLRLVTGTSLLFIGFIIALIFLLDVEVDIDEWTFEVKKTIKYKLTIVWAVILVLLGISAIYFSNKYRKQYAFECETFLVDSQSGVYHLDWDNDCEIAAEADDLELMKGYQIDKSFSLCPWCAEWAEEAEYEAESNMHYRK